MLRSMLRSTLRFTSRAVALALALASLGAPVSADGEVWVDAVSGDDFTGLGTEAAPYRTITRGVQALAATPGLTTVHIAPGLYGPSLGESFPVVMKSGMSLLGSGAHHTVLTGEGGGVLIRNAGQTLVSDLTLQRATTGLSSPGKAFALEQVRYLRRCIVRQCDVGVDAVDDLHSDQAVAIVNSFFEENGIAVRGLSTSHDFQSVTVLLYGTTVTRNQIGVLGGTVDTGIERYVGLLDSIVYGNGDDTISGWSAIWPDIDGNVLGDPTWLGFQSNIVSDPSFADSEGGDWHLAPTSVAIDNDAPAVPWPPAGLYIGTNGWIWESSFVDVLDMDGAPRVGPPDPGADEVVLPTLYSVGFPSVGGTLTLRTQSAPSSLVLPVLGFSVFDTPLAGLVWLAPPTFLLAAPLADADGLASLPFFVPADPTLIGADVYFQVFEFDGVDVGGSGPHWIRLLP